MIRPLVWTIPIIPNWLTGPIQLPSHIASTTVITVRPRIAFHGVFQRGWTYESQRGSAPIRPLLKKTRVDAFWLAIATANAEFTVATRTVSQAPHHNRRARSKTWWASATFRAAPPVVRW